MRPAPPGPTRGGLCPDAEDLDREASSIGVEVARDIGVEVARGIGVEVARGIGVEVARDIGVEVARGIGVEVARGIGVEVARGIGDKRQQPPPSAQPPTIKTRQRPP